MKTVKQDLPTALNAISVVRDALNHLQIVISRQF